jgi:hypothetical protein
MKTRKLLAICCRSENHNDFQAIAKRIISKAPEIAVVIKSGFYHPDELEPALKNFPLLNLYLVNPPQVIPSRGKTMYVERINKFEQIKQYTAAGIATPKTIEYELGQPINNCDWGEYVFLKSGSSSHSENSFLIPTKYVLDIKPYFEKLGLSNKMLVQQFIYTGEYANHYRILIFLGEPLYCTKISNPYRLLLPSNLDEVFNNKTTQTSLQNIDLQFQSEINQEVLNFSRKVYNVFKEQPLQGIDIVAEQSTKKLFVLEGNQGGNVWTFSLSKSKMRAALGRTALLTQFNAFDVAADVLIKKTEELAI